MAQRFYANPRDAFTHKNGAVGYRSGGPMDCLGPYAKVTNCPIDVPGRDIRLTCYATAYADTFFSIPACTRYKGKYVSGFFTSDDEGVKFHPHDKHKGLFSFGAIHETPATRIFHEQAQSAESYGASVDCDSSFSTVAIDWKGGECFMQDYEADQFISEIDELCKRFPSLNRGIAELAMALPYVENLSE